MGRNNIIIYHRICKARSSDCAILVTAVGSGSGIVHWFVPIGLANLPCCAEFYIFFFVGLLLAIHIYDFEYPVTVAGEV